MELIRLTRKVKGILFVMLSFFAIIFTFNHFLGYSVGDSILNAIGVGAWSDNEYPQGFHYSIILGLILLVIGYKFSRYYLNDLYPTWMRRLKFIIIAMILIYPYITEKLMYIVKIN